MCDVIYARHGANGAPCHIEIRRDLHHCGEALGGKLSQESKDTALIQVAVDPDGEERVHEMHLYVYVDHD